jgi:peroxiredoxin
LIELGQLEKQHAKFAEREVRIVAISNDDQATAKLTQADFPHLTIVSDADLSLAKAVEVVHAGAAQDGGDTSAPTTLLMDGDGVVRWLFRPSHINVRMSPEQVLAAIDENLATKK